MNLSVFLVIPSPLHIFLLYDNVFRDRMEDYARLCRCTSMAFVAYHKADYFPLKDYMFKSKSPLHLVPTFCSAIAQLALCPTDQYRYQL